MTKKRIADNYLTHDNWDDPEEDEVAQVYYIFIYNLYFIHYF